MAFNEEYREMVEEARTVIGKLLDASQPDAWLRLRAEYGELRRALALDDKANDLLQQAENLRQQIAQKQDLEAERAAQHQEYGRRRDAWRRLDREVKKGRILTALGGDGLTRREIVKRITEVYPDTDLYENDLAALLNEMLAAGELEREKEPRSPNCTVKATSGYRWRWRRNSASLSPELADLEQRLKEA